jgi:hypothetical protein
MKQLGFTRPHSDAGIFLHKRFKVICIAYVDDCIFAGKDLSMVIKIKQVFMKKWECRDLGKAKEFLKIKIRCEGRKIILDQQDYLDKIVARFHLQKSNTARTPLPTGYEPEVNKGTATPQFRQEYQSVIGSLLYIMLGTRQTFPLRLLKWHNSVPIHLLNTWRNTNIF